MKKINVTLFVLLIIAAGTVYFIISKPNDKPSPQISPPPSTMGSSRHVEDTPSKKQPLDVGLKVKPVENNREEELGKKHARVHEHIKNKEYGKAKTELESLMEAEPQNVSNYGLMAQVCEIEDDHDAARNAIEKGIKCNSDPKILCCLYVERGNYEDEAGEYEKAAQTAQKAIELNPSHMTCYCLLADACYHMKDTKRAKKYADFFLKKSKPPTEYRDFVNYAVIHKSIGQYEESIKYDELAIKKDPSKPMAITDLGRTYVETGDYKKARETLNRVVAMGPSADRSEAVNLLESIRDK